MEDKEKQDRDFGNSIEESENKVLVAKIESEGEKFPCAVTVSEDANKSEKGVDNLNKLTNDEAKDSITVKSDMEDQTNPESQTNEQMNVEGSTKEQVNTKSKNEEGGSSKANVEEQTTARSIVDQQTDANNEVVELNATSGVVTEENSSKDGADGGNPVENVMEGNPCGDAAVEKPKDIGRDVGDCVEQVARGEITIDNAEIGGDRRENGEFTTELSSNEAPQNQNAAVDEVQQGEDREMEVAANADKAVKDEPKEQAKEIVRASRVTDGHAMTVQTATKHEGNDSSLPDQHEASSTPNAVVRYSPAKAGDHSGETVKAVFTQASLPLLAEGDDGTPEDQAAFMKELESFYRGKAMDFKPPKFYGQPLNCLKLWRAVIRLGGYDRVTGSKLWRQVGESFHPPKTCTTVSWTFRIFYEKSLLEYERHKRQSGELQLPVAPLPEASAADSEDNGYQGSGSGSGRARRDAAARAMQGWHVQRLFGYGEVGEPVIKDKNLNNMAKRDKNGKAIGSLKQKRSNEVEHSIKAARTETSKQLVTSVVDVGPPADWVKINVRQTKDCFEVYALVPGLLREEVRVQSDPAGRLVITGQPEQVDNPWGITPFKKVVSLPARIDPLQTSAVVSLHGRLFVRVPFEQSNM
ncbi:AT-rich interactive domain-containing protein 5 [Sesamum alatum]|uniref:AT-rich interactive domain-containing protein 5 n=1 Tax=Sesamum alatum TaxID=300844 RepID=A0AAE1YDR8_9LAMI|nr:AT-rich interactive domain-containing protein 5 [Sesamum alatum]